MNYEELELMVRESLKSLSDRLEGTAQLHELLSSKLTTLLDVIMTPGKAGYSEGVAEVKQILKECIGEFTDGGKLVALGKDYDVKYNALLDAALHADVQVDSAKFTECGTYVDHDPADRYLDILAFGNMLNRIGYTVLDSIVDESITHHGMEKFYVPAILANTVLFIQKCNQEKDGPDYNMQMWNRFFRNYIMMDINGLMAEQDLLPFQEFEEYMESDAFTQGAIALTDVSDHSIPHDDEDAAIAEAFMANYRSIIAKTNDRVAKLRYIVSNLDYTNSHILPILKSTYEIVTKAYSAYVDSQKVKF